MLTGNAVRGCGSRQKGGVYLCHGMSEFGSPIEDFILDPVIEWKGEWQRGYKIVPSASGHNNVVIFVGESFYKCLWDYVEETRWLGASRKVADNFPFDKLTPGKSYMLFAHRRAYWTEQFKPPLLVNRPIPLDGCKFDYEDFYLVSPGDHYKQSTKEWGLCTFSHRDLSYFFHQDKELKFDNEGHFTVKLPSIEYQGNVPSIENNFPKIEYVNPKTDFKPGIFLALLLTHIEMPYTPNIKAQNEANKAGYEVYVTEY